MELASIGLECLTEPVAIRVIVFLGKETRLAVVTALDDVQRESCKMDAGAAGMKRSLTKYSRLTKHSGKA